MPATFNQEKGNAAEYLVCYELQRQGIPAWILGGNNKRWDIVFQAGEDEFTPAQVKTRTQSTISLKREDLKPSKGYYFIWYTPGTSEHKNSKRLAIQLEKITKDKLGEARSSTMLVYSAKTILSVLKKGEALPSNQGKSSLMTSLTKADIIEGLNGYQKFFDKYKRR